MQAADGEQKRSMTQNITIGVLLLLLIIVSILLGIFGVNDKDKDLVRVLFIGNSFTYGPGDHTDPTRLHNLPTMFKELGESLGKEIKIGEETIGGCILDMYIPQDNPSTC